MHPFLRFPIRLQLSQMLTLTAIPRPIQPNVNPRESRLTFRHKRLRTATPEVGLGLAIPAGELYWEPPAATLVGSLPTASMCQTD